MPSETFGKCLFSIYLEISYGPPKISSECREKYLNIIFSKRTKCRLAPVPSKVFNYFSLQKIIGEVMKAIKM